MNYKKIAVIFFSILLIICLLLFYLGVLIQFFLYPSIYMESLEKANVFDTIDQNLAQTPNAQFIKMEDSKSFVHSIISNILSYLRSDTEALNLTVAIDKGELKDFFVNQTEKVRICDKDEKPDYTNLDTICRPADQNAEVFVSEFLEEKSLDFFEKDTVDLAQLYGFNENSEGKKMLDRIRKIISVYQIILYVSLGLIAFLIFLIFLMRDTPKKFVRIIGIDIIISLIMSFIIGLLLFSLANSLMNGKNEYLILAADAIISSIVERAFIILGIFFIISIILIVSSFLMKKK